MEKKEFEILDIITMITFFIIIFGFGISIYIIPSKEFSEQENRYLQQQPKISYNSEFTNKISNFYADQFPIRDIFVGVKAAIEIALRKGENNDVVLGKDGYIIKKNSYPSYDIVESNIKRLKKFAVKSKKLNINYAVAIAGRSEDILINNLPEDYPMDISKKLWKYTNKELNNTDDMLYIDLYTTFIDKEKQCKTSNLNEYNNRLYYKTDHHWTSYGAYIASCQILKSFGKTIEYSFKEYNIKKVSDAFYGTTWSSAGMKWIKPDSIEYYRYEDDNDFITKIVNKDTVFEGFYDFKYLNKKDKYSSFIGGNNVRVDIYKKNDIKTTVSREKMLIIKDSFAHSAVPFLAQRYDLIIIDPRYYISSISELCEQENIKNVLVLINMDTLVSKKDFSLMR